MIGAVVLVALAGLAALLWRENQIAAERLEWSRERAELLNRLLHDERPFVPPIVTPIKQVPRPGDNDPEPDGYDLIGRDVSHLDFAAGA